MGASLSFVPPEGYRRVKIVSSFAELVDTPMGGADGINALCWPRSLRGDFHEIIMALGLAGDDEITSLDDEDLLGLDLSPAGCEARDWLLRDRALLRDQGLDPLLDCIPAYPRAAEPGLVPTDVYSFHADSATAMADTYLCSYNEASSEGVRNEQTICCVDEPATRAALREEFGGPDDAAFRTWLGERFYDLHYDALPGAQLWSFGLGNLWRIATQCPGSPVPACIHRAPTTNPGQAPRLLLIS